MNDVEYYMSLNYPIVLSKIWDDDGQTFIYSAMIRELLGLKVYGDSYEEVLSEVEEAKEAWFEANLEMGREIPEPLTTTGVSGRVTLRMTKSLHLELKKRASDEGVSLNPMITELITKGLKADLSEKMLQTIEQLRKDNEKLLDQNCELIRQLNVLNAVHKKPSYELIKEDKGWKTQGLSILNGSIL